MVVRFKWRYPARSGRSAPRSHRLKAVLSTSTSYTSAGTTIGSGPGRRGGPRTRNSYPEGGWQLEAWV